ncbi:Pheromone B alpha 1 receptor [Mycena kentingensis (nom. inval.)]|nr:Pheromone B alpha 1 receptor [Mycena kentingensis (nom. inval.)]
MSYYYSGAPDWVFQTFAFVGFVLSFIPLPWHLEAYNVATCAYMIWTGLACLVLFINSIVWQGNMLDMAPTWCDISTHFLNGFNLAIPATSLCINRRLYQIASVRTVTKTKTQQRREIIVDLLISVGLPVLQIPLQYIVQGHRYNIFEDIGCLGTTYENPLSIVLWHLPPILVGCVSAIYCVLSIRGFYASRKQFKELLASGNNNLNLNRYLRLMALASIDLIFNIPLGIWVLYTNVNVVGLSPWRSWADTHSNFSRVVQVPAFFWRRDPMSVASLETMRWATIFCAFVFWGFFGFASEARKNYRLAYYKVASKLGLSTSATLGASGNTWSANGMSSKGNPASLPSFVRRPSTRKRDSLDSLSSAEVDRLSYHGGKEKTLPFGGNAGDYTQSKSFAGLSLQDVGNLLPAPDYKSEIGVSPVESSESGSSFRGDASDAGSVVLPAAPAPAHVHNPRDIV